MPRGFSGRVFDKSALRTWDLLSPSSMWYYPVLLWGEPAESSHHLQCVGVHGALHLHPLPLPCLNSLLASCVW